MSILNAERPSHGFGDRAIFEDISFRLLKDKLKRALPTYRHSILMVCHKPEFYSDIVSVVWDRTKGTPRIIGNPFGPQSASIVPAQKK